MWDLTTGSAPGRSWPEAGVARDSAIQAMAGGRLKAVPICDCELTFRSHISDEEDHRFQLPVSVLGEELDRHEGGTAYRWGGRDMLLRRGVRLRLVNVGAASLVREGRLGYPMSFAGSQCMSPFASQRQLDEFSNSMQERYSRPVEWNGFYTDMAADAITLQNMDNTAEAYSVLEAIRAGMSLVLGMDREDLEILVIARMGLDQVDGFLYDPMPRLREWGTTFSVAHEIPPRMPAEPPREGKTPSNLAEERLRQMMKRAGLPEFEWQKRIFLGPPHGSTTPDAFSPMDDIPGLCVYLDGLSRHLHGNPRTAARDREIRAALRAGGYEVVEIAASDLDDRDAMAIHLARIARILVGKDAARVVREDRGWFEA